MIILKEVSKDYLLPGGQRLRVLDKMSFELGDKTFNSVLGPSGCGKSTILNLIAGLDNHSSGQISIDGKKTGFVFQQPRLLKWRTVVDNVILPLEADDFDKETRRQFAFKYLRLVGLGGCEDYFPLQLSGGMQQRVAIARALVIEPDVLLMDEPFSHLDELTARAQRRELLRFRDKIEATVVFVTHNALEAVYLADRVFVLGARPARIKAA